VLRRRSTRASGDSRPAARRRHGSAAARPAPPLPASARRSIAARVTCSPRPTPPRLEQPAHRAPRRPARRRRPAALQPLQQRRLVTDAHLLRPRLRRHHEHAVEGSGQPPRSPRRTPAQSPAKPCPAWPHVRQAPARRPAAGASARRRRTAARAPSRRSKTLVPGQPLRLGLRHHADARQRRQRLVSVRDRAAANRGRRGSPAASARLNSICADAAAGRC